MKLPLRVVLIAVYGLVAAASGYAAYAVFGRDDEMGILLTILWPGLSVATLLLPYLAARDRAHMDGANHGRDDGFTSNKIAIAVVVWGGAVVKFAFMAATLAFGLALILLLLLYGISLLFRFPVAAENAFLWDLWRICLPLATGVVPVIFAVNVEDEIGVGVGCLVFATGVTLGVVGYFIVPGLAHAINPFIYAIIGAVVGCGFVLGAFPDSLDIILGDYREQNQ